MTDFVVLDNDDIGANKIFRAATVSALYTNPTAIAQRQTNAPIVQVPVREYFTTVGTTVWNIPDGVTAIRAYLISGGSSSNPTFPSSSAKGGSSYLDVDGTIYGVSGGGQTYAATNIDFDIQDGALLHFYSKGIYGVGGVFGGDVGIDGTYGETRILIPNGVTTLDVVVGGGGVYAFGANGTQGIIVLEY